MSRSYKFSALKAGDTIGVIALASPSEPHGLKSGISFLEDQGFKVKVALNPSKFYAKNTHLFSSDSPKKRAAALHALLKDRQVKAILATRGGYGSMQLLPEIDFSLFRKHPKALVGLSDITAILVAANKLAGVPTLHGAGVQSAFSQARKDKFAKKSALSLIEYLRGNPQNHFEQAKLRTLVKAKLPVEGVLVGGNLSLLASLIGTKWEADLDSKILFLEDVAEKPYRIHRMLLQMKLAGKFRRLKGVLLGDFSGCNDPRPAAGTLKQVFHDIFSDLKIPVVGFAPFGHERLNLPIPLGIKARLSSRSLHLLEPFVF